MSPPPRRGPLRWVAPPLAAAFGVALMLGGVLVMNQPPPPREAGEGRAVALSAPPPPPKTTPPAPAPRPRPRSAAKSAAPPAPMLGAALSGLSFGLDALSPGAVGAEAAGLIGPVTDAVMSAASVDEPPQPLSQVPPRWPEAARRRGLSGSVTLSLLIGVDGAIQEVSVLESQPPGVFDAAATEAVRQWRFSPGQYEGRPVSVRVTQPVVFNLEAP
jgi:protein TonB